MIVIQRDTSEYEFAVTVTAIPIGESVSSEVVSDSHVIFREDSFNGNYCNYRIGTVLAGVTATVESPEIFAFADEIAVRSANGSGYLRLASPTHSQRVRLDFTSTNEYTQKHVTGFTEGSYGEFSETNIIGRIGGENSDLAYFNGASLTECASNGGIQRNPSCWGKDWDFSGVAIKYLYNGFWGGGAMITRRHYVVTNHYDVTNKVGWTLQFLTSGGQVITRTIVAQTTGSDIPMSGTVGNTSYPVGDVCVFLLDSPVPEDVAVYPIAGDWIKTQTIGDDVGGGVHETDLYWAGLFVTLDQFRRVKFTCATFHNTTHTTYYPPRTLDVRGFVFTESTSPAYFQGPWVYDDETYAGYQIQAIQGDSGSPVFAPTAGNGLALISLFTLPQSGTLHTESLLNAMILEVDDRAGVSTGLTVTAAPDPTA